MKSSYEFICLPKNLTLGCLLGVSVKGLSVVNRMVDIHVGLIVFFKTTLFIIVCGTFPSPPPSSPPPLPSLNSPPTPSFTAQPPSPSYHGHVHTILFTFCIKNPKKKNPKLNTDEKNIWQSVDVFNQLYMLKPPTSPARWNGSNNGPRWVLCKGGMETKNQK